MANISERFSGMLYELSVNPPPERVLAKAQQCFIDYLSVTIGGSPLYKDRNLAFLDANRVSGPIHIIGMNRTADLHSAVMINAFNAHTLELDDSHRVAMTHLGAPVFSALLGTGELYDVTIDKLLRAAVVGYEAAVRLAASIQPGHKKRGFHVSGTCCTVGAAMGIAAMLDYSADEMSRVLSAAATSAAGLLAVISGKSEQKPYNIANAAVSGADAALYGRLFFGAEDILGESRGFLRAMSDEFSEEKLFGGGFAIETVYQKLYAACRHCHAPMEAMLELRDKYGFDAEQITGITVRTYDLAIKGHDHTDIAGVSSAKQSIPYGVSAACVLGDCGTAAFTDENVKNDRILSLARKVRVVEDPELTAYVPAKRAAAVDVALRDGRVLSRQVDYAKGEPENPITDAEFELKFASLVSGSGVTLPDGLKAAGLVRSGRGESVRKLFEWI